MPRHFHNYEFSHESSLLHRQSLRNEFDTVGILIKGCPLLSTLKLHMSCVQTPTQFVEYLVWFETYKTLKMIYGVCGVNYPYLTQLSESLLFCASSPTVTESVRKVSWSIFGYWQHFSILNISSAGL